MSGTFRMLRTRVRHCIKRRGRPPVGRLRLSMGAILSRIETGTPHALQRCMHRRVIRRIWGRSNATFKWKSFNIRMKKRWPFAIWQAFVCRNLWYQTEGNLDLSIPIARLLTTRACTDAKIVTRNLNRLLTSTTPVEGF
jgi:hypothetical protein